MDNPFDQFDPQPSGVAPPLRSANPFDQFDAAPDFSGVTVTVNGERVGKSGVRESQRRAQIASMDQANDYEGQLSALNKQESLGRSLGIGARAMWRGLAAIPDIVVAPLAYGINKLGEKDPTPTSLITGERERYFPKQATITETSDYLMDKMGAPRPETAQERISSDITSALTGTATTLGLGAWLQGARLPGTLPTATQGVGDVLASQPVLQGVSAVTGAGAASATREGGGGQLAQITAGLGAGLAPVAATTLPAMTARWLVRGNSGANTQATLNTFRASGTTPSVGQASGNRGAQALETLLGNVPGGAGVVENFAQRQAQQVSGRLDDLASNLTPRGATVTAEQAGRSIVRGVEGSGGFMDRFRRQSSQLYGELDQTIPPSTQVPATNVTQYLAQQTAPIPGATATSKLLANPRLSGIREGLEADLASGNGSIPYEALARLRTQVGEMIADAGLVSDVPTRQLRQLYGAFSEDMRAAANATGNPAAIKAFNRANNHYKFSINRIEAIEHVIERNGGPEKVYAAAFSGTRDGATTLRALMQSLPKEVQRELTGSFIRRMGRAVSSQQGAAGDVFSMETFLTNWDKVSPEARKVMFDRHGPTFTRDMDKIARMAERVREGSRVFRNNSGTSRQVALTTQIAGTGVLAGQQFLQGNLAGAIYTVAGSAGAAGLANALSRAMTSPRFVSWLARSTEMPVGALPAQIWVLRRMGESSNDESITEVADQLERQQAAR